MQAYDRQTGQDLNLKPKGCYEVPPQGVWASRPMEEERSCAVIHLASETKPQSAAIVPVRSLVRTYVWKKHHFIYDK